MKILFCLFLFFPFSSFAECITRSGALDFGSGTTKALVIEVDRCQKKLGRTLFEERVATPFNEALEKSPDGKIPESVVRQQLGVFQELVKKMRSHNPQEILAVATSVYRMAKNGEAVARSLSKDLGISLEVISQEREAELGYWSALAAKGLQPNERVVVWDIGGGSMQMFSLREGKTHIYKGDLASVSFKNRVLSEILKKDVKTVTSPNPLKGKSQEAVKLAAQHARENVSPFFKENAQRFRWIGVGGVLSMSVQDQSNKGASHFSRSELERNLKKRAFLRDEQMESEYKATDVTNLALVLGYMQQLKIPRVETAKVTLGQGLVYQRALSLP